MKDLYLNGYNLIIGNDCYLLLGNCSKDNYTMLGKQYEDNIMFYKTDNWFSEMLYAIDGNLYYYSFAKIMCAGCTLRTCCRRWCPDDVGASPVRR